MQHNHFILRLIIGAMLLGIVVYLCNILPRLDSLNAVLAVTLLLSLLVGAVNCYCYIIRATKTSLTFDPKGWIVWMLARRSMGYVVILMLAFLSSFCFVIHVPSLNNIGFGFIFLTVPVFAGVYYCFRKIFEGQSVDWMINGRSLLCSLVVTPLVMVLLYGLGLNYSDLPVHGNLQAAIDAQPKPWDDTNSALIRNASEWSILWGACRDFGFGQLFQANRYIAIILVSIGYWALFFNICSLLASVFVPLREYKRLVLPLIPSLDLPKILPKQLISLCPTLIVLVSLCFALFNWEERDAAMIPDPEPVKVGLIKIGDRFFNKDVETLRTELQEKLHDELNRAVAGPLGKLEGFQGTLTHYNAQRVELQNRLMGLQNNTFIELKKLHEEELFPRMDRNIDAYLDWYYSITGEYVRLGNLAAGNIEGHLKGKLNEYLMKNVNYQKAEGLMKRFSEESGKITAQIAVFEELTKQLLKDAAEVSEEVARIKEEFQIKGKQEVDAMIAEHEVPPPENISSVIIDGDYVSMDDFLESFQDISFELSSLLERVEIYTNEMQDLLKIFTYHSNEYLFFKGRMTMAGVVGIAGLARGTALGARIASKVAGKQAFKIAVEAVAKLVVKRAIGGGGGAVAGAAVGAGVGSVVPVVGTGIGAAAGGAIGGIGAWIATDYALVKLEEYLSRENFKREILSSVNEQKAEVMKALEDIFQVNKSTVPQTLDEINQKQGNER